MSIISEGISHSSIVTLYLRFYDSVFIQCALLVCSNSFPQTIHKHTHEILRVRQQ